MLSPLSAAELGLDFTHKITLELPKKFKIVFENDGTSKSYVYTEFKHLVKDEIEPYYWKKSLYFETPSDIPLTTLNSSKYYCFSPSFDVYNSLYNNLNLITKGKNLKFLGYVVNKEELYNTNYELGSVVFCEEDNNDYILTCNGWDVIKNEVSLKPAKWVNTSNEQLTNKSNEPTFHEESYWEYVEVKNERED